MGYCWTWNYIESGSFLFLTLKIPMHFTASGIADDYSNKIQISLFPLIQY